MALIKVKLYKKCDNVAMNQCITPILANIFLCINEKKCPLNYKPTLYKQCMCDNL